MAVKTEEAAPVPIPCTRTKVLFDGIYAADWVAPAGHAHDEFMVDSAKLYLWPAGTAPAGLSPDIRNSPEAVEKVGVNAREMLKCTTLSTL